MITKFSKGVVALTAFVAAAALVLSGPAKAASGVAAGFEGNSAGNVQGFAWNVNTGSVSKATNGAGGANTAMFGVSANGSVFVGVEDNSGGTFQVCTWGGSGAASGQYFDSGVAQGFPGNDTAWSVNDAGVSIGQGVGQISGYDQGFFAQIEWPAGGASVVDTNTFTDPSGNVISGGTTIYGGPIYIEGFDFTGVGLSGSGINNAGQSSGTSFQNFGSFFYQGTIAQGGKVYVIPYTDSGDPAATSWNISGGGATCGYNFESSLSVAYGYTATVNTSGYSFGANGGSGTLNNYGQGPNANFQWFIDNNDSGNGSGQAVGFDIDNTGSFNHDVYDANKSTSQEVASDRGGNTTFLIGVASDGTSAGFETIAADGETNFHAWGTKTGTPGATTDYPEASGIVGSKAFEVSGNGGGATNPVKSITIKGKPKHGKPIKGTVTLNSPSVGVTVVTVTNSLPAGDLANFTVSVPNGASSATFKSPKLSKTSKGHTGHLTGDGTVNSANFTVK